MCFEVTPMFSNIVKDAYDLMEEYPELGDIYLKDSLPVNVGDVVKNPSIAKTLEKIIDEGADGFYKGEVAEAIVEASNKYGGIISFDDLANYKVTEMEPVRGTYRGYEIISSPPPSSGGTHLVQILNMLETFDMSKVKPYSGEHMHILSELFKMAYADRAEYMGDPNYVDVPLKGLASKDYAKELVKKFDMDMQEAINMPRVWDNLDNTVWYQDGIEDAEVQKLIDKGHEVFHYKNDTFGYIQGALYLDDGTIHGGADPYTDSKAVGF